MSHEESRKSDSGNGKSVSWMWLAGTLAAALGGLIMLFINYFLSQQSVVNAQQNQTNLNVSSQIQSIDQTLSEHTALLFLIANKLGISPAQLKAIDPPTAGN